MMYRVDLHTHSTASPDGGVTMEGYQDILNSSTLDYVAITDHNRIDFAQSARKLLGDRIIVGEEIMSSAGEIIGLYLEELVEPGQTPQATMQAIKEQGGIVYIPHPFETVRKGLHPQVMEELSDHIDIIEVCNGRAFLQNKSEQAVVWARLNPALSASSSDAHGQRGLGKTYTKVAEPVSRDNVLQQLAHGTMVTDRPSLRSLLYPSYHRWRKKVRKA